MVLTCSITSWNAEDSLTFSIPHHMASLKFSTLTLNDLS